MEQIVGKLSSILRQNKFEYYSLIFALFHIWVFTSVELDWRTILSTLWCIWLLLQRTAAAIYCLRTTNKRHKKLTDNLWRGIFFQEDKKKSEITTRTWKCLTLCTLYIFKRELKLLALLHLYNLVLVGLLSQFSPICMILAFWHNLNNFLIDFEYF